MPSLTRGSLSGSARAATMRNKVDGMCPACRTHSLYVVPGGTITCGLRDCPDPGLLDRVLRDFDLLGILREIEARKWRGKDATPMKALGWADARCRENVAMRIVMGGDE